MARRIDIELTSSRDDGSWTWRAAGARQPKGVLEASLLYPHAKVGDVVRAEADFEIEGITITAVFPPKEKRSEPDRLEMIGPPGEFQGVTSSLVPKGEQRRDDDRRGPRERRDRSGEGRPGGPRAPRPGGDRGGPPREREPHRERGGRPPGERADRPAAEHAPRPGRDRGARPGGDRGPRPGAVRGPERAGRPPGEPPGRTGEAPARAAPPRPKRLSAGNAHRQTVLNGLTPEHRPIAEQVLRGGIPAVRQAIEQQNAQARADGHPEVKPGPLVAIAEDLLPRLKAAD